MKIGIPDFFPSTLLRSRRRTDVRKSRENFHFIPLSIVAFIPQHKVERRGGGCEWIIKCYFNKLKNCGRCCVSSIVALSHSSTDSAPQLIPFIKKFYLSCCRVFINNGSFGVYYAFLRRQWERFVGRKWLNKRERKRSRTQKKGKSLTGTNSLPLTHRSSFSRWLCPASWWPFFSRILEDTRFVSVWTS